MYIINCDVYYLALLMDMLSSWLAVFGFSELPGKIILEKAFSKKALSSTNFEILKTNSIPGSLLLEIV